jgi:hypothetical protein
MKPSHTPEQTNKYKTIITVVACTLLALTVSVIVTEPQNHSNEVILKHVVDSVKQDSIAADTSSWLVGGEIK